jgi:hypothetical protein
MCVTRTIKKILKSKLPAQVCVGSANQPPPAPRPWLVRSGASWCHIEAMAGADRTVRQSVSIPAGIARRVRTLARTRKTSANRVLVDLIVAGLQSKESEKGRVFLLVSRLTESSDRDERERLKEELARMTFGV